MARQILQSGVTSAEVERLQADLKTLGYSLDVDGTFDEATKAVVMQFQTDRNLTVDGIVGSETGRALGMALAA